MKDKFEEKDFSDSRFSASIWKKILRMVLKKKKNLAIMIVSIIGLTTLDVIYPLFNAYALENYFGDNPDFSTMYTFIALYTLIALGFGITVYGFIKAAGNVEVEVAYEIREEAFKKLQELPFAYYDKTPAGWIMARLTSDSRRLATILSWGMVDMIWSTVSMFGIIVILYIINWRLALVITGLLPVLFVVSLYFRRKILFAYRDVRKTNSKITASYNEGIMGNKTTKTLVLEDKKLHEFDELTNKMRKDSMRAVLFSSAFLPIIILISFIGIAFILRIGGGYVINPMPFAFGVATLYLFISYTLQFFEPVMQLARVLAELQQAQASAERIISLIETKPEIFDSEEVINKYGTIFKPKRENWEELYGDIEFKNVTFKYDEGETVLENFNLKIKKGTSVALVGETGSGKSTIVNLICRFYEPKEGIIEIDGKDYKERSIGWLHNNLGYVLQTPHLFNENIMENIRYGNLEATDEEVIKAAEAVSADTFIKEFPEGYKTVVGEGGSKLSMGQRQLVSFARALIADPKILILDEATSSIDTKTEEIIQGVINKILKGRTSFIIAHRLSTIINADMILVIKDGKILEKGSHQELLNQRGEYYNLYKNQFINEAIEKTKY